MRIAQVATLSSPVHDGPCGSVEGLVWLLSDQLQKLGHDVTVFATADSTPPCNLVGTLPGPYAQGGSPDDWHVCEWMNLCRSVEASGEFDVLHTHAYLWGLPLERFSSCPMVHTMHVLPYQASAALWRSFPEAHVTALSKAQWAAFPDLRPLATIPHGLDPARHTFSAGPGEYLCFLGRFTPGKGAVEAISAARSLGLPLRLAGPANDFFRECVEPLIDGELVSYVGYVDPAERDELLRGAQALVYPVQSPEPFGLVLVESMLTGTPVAALGLGAVTEIVEEGLTGAWEPAGCDLAPAIERCLSLDRGGVRARAVERFSPEAMAAQYGAVFERVANPVRS